MNRFKTFSLIIVTGLLALQIWGCQQKEEIQKEPLNTDLGTQIANHFGAKKFDQIQKMTFTFNLTKGDRTIKRQWVWEPEGKNVEYYGENKDGAVIKHSYSRDALDEGELELNHQIDQMFINDQYWLLFPFHLKWDSDVQIIDDGEQLMPISETKGTRYIVKFADNEGYTPGDIYELYVGPDHLIKEWLYRRGGQPETSMMTTWEKYMMVGPLVLSLDRRDPGSGFHVWFTDVGVQLKGQEEMLTPRELTEADRESLGIAK